jgi:hypothetical protein
MTSPWPAAALIDSDNNTPPFLRSRLDDVFVLF